MNEWGGEGRDIPERPNAVQALSLDKISEAYLDFGAPPTALTPAGALSELCHSRATYDSGRSDVQPYAKERVSWPPPASKPSDMLAGLPADMQWLGQWKCHLLRDDAEAVLERQRLGLREAYMDPILKTNPVVYGDFLQTLFKAGMLGYEIASSSDYDLGVFCVFKKDGKSFRLIFDTRLINTKFARPPATELPSAAAFANPEVV